ncbi:MAG: hypothetical protein ACMVY4_01630 [Minwuia sp.]|uniref:hypothetical protein n=1 Tax=Minwuia sp. TaxID=2493630 RepID=UPI003A85AC08
MPIETVEHGDFVEFRVSTAVASSEIIRHVHDYYSVHATPLVLWSFAPGTLVNIPAADFREIARETGLHYAARGDRARTSIVVATEAELLLVKAFIAWAEADPTMPIDCSTDRDQALACLLEETGKTP